MSTPQKPMLKLSGYNESPKTPTPPRLVLTPSLSAPAVLKFQPNPFQQGLQDSFDSIPRYLFRTHAPNTAGTTSISNVTSPAWSCGRSERKRDLFLLPRDEAAALLNEHLRWTSSHERECNLMSWTSSLLFAIQYALYRHGQRKGRDFDRPELSRIFLLVVDTRQFPLGTFVKDLEVIEAFKGYSEDLASMHRLRTERGYYFGEYLTQGDLDIEGRCSQTSIQQIIHLGLFDLYPEIGKKENWQKWANQVLALRQVFQEPYPAARTERSDFRKAITIAQCFGDQWALPVATMLLSFKPRQQDDAVILNGFRAVFTDTEIETLSLRHIKIDSRGLPEVRQYENIIRDLRHQFEEAETTLLTNPFERLRLEFDERDDQQPRVCAGSVFGGRGRGHMVSRGIETNRVTIKEYIS